MRCPTCQCDCPAEFTFCPQCGALLQRTCEQCGFRAPAQFSFCPQCGSALAAPAMQAERDTQAMLSHAVQRLIPKEWAERLRATQGQVSQERRLVTILFCDVKGSTAMAEQLDPEDWAEIMNGAFEYLIPPIYLHEGTLAQLMGDGLLAFFGAPVSHEDDPERAIRAGLEIAAGVQTYAEALERTRGIAGFNVRVGINTGLVVIGEMGSDLRVAYTAMGDAINLAARMEQNAPPGGVLITHDTYRHVRGVFDVLPQEALMVKGKSDPVLTYLVQAAKVRALRKEIRGVEGIETRMVGRELELLALQRAFEDVLEDNETCLVTVTGEAGVGKSRLLDEFDLWAELQPERFWFFKGRASASTQTVPYSLMRDMLAYRFEILDSDGAATVLAKLRQGMGGILEPDRADLVGQLVGFDLEAAGSEAAHALLGSPNFAQLASAYFVQYVRGLAREHPLLMLLEDLQWADDSSLDLVAHLVAEIPRAPLLIVAAARPELFERRPNWGEGRELYSRLELKPLSKRATRSLVEEILQKADELPETLRELIVEAAEGNPYYVEELIKMLIEDGIIVRQEPNWRVELQRLAEVRVPPTLTAVLQARLDALPQDEKAVLQRASVVGRRFWDSLVGELASDTDQGTEVQPLLGALRQRELVFQREQSSFANAREYTFKHAILRDVTYETVLLRLRRRYHAQVAAWLEAHAGQRLSEYLGVIAGHYELAGERVRAAEYLRRSGEEALRTSAYRDAQAAFERALGLLPAELGEQRGTVAVRLGQTLLRLGEFSAAGAQLEEGLTLARSAGEHGTEVVALNALGEAAWRRGHWEAALGHLRNALALAQDCGDLSGQALAAQQLARVSWLHCEPDEAERWAQQSRDCCAQAGDRQGLIAARNELGNVANLRREFEQAREFYSANLALAGELGDRFAIAQALNNLGTIAYELGAYKEASAYYEQALVINDEIGNRVGLIIALGNLAELYITQGQDDPAWEYLRQALRQVVSIQAVVSATVPLLVYVARLRARAGQLERAAELLGMALSHPASSSDAEWDAQQVLGTLREALGAERLEAALARGAKLDAERVVAEILAEDNP